MRSPVRPYEKVFGIGLNKTGTTSLKLAFEALGFTHLERRPRLFKLWQKADLPGILAATDEYESFEDWPWPLIVPELRAHFGDRARFVLTTRKSPEAWVASLKAHAERTNPHRNPRQAIFGDAYPHGLEEKYAAYYERHNAAVRAQFNDRPDLLLEVCWETGDGWRELCRFLGLKKPFRRFPQANRSRDAQPNAEFVAENRTLIAAQLQQIQSRD